MAVERRADDESPELVIELVAECLQRLDALPAPERAAGAAGVMEGVCAEHPQAAAAVRERVQLLLRAGFAGDDDGRRPTLRTLGRYRIVGELGRGGMGVVYLALDPTLGRLVALKALATRLVASPVARARFEREIKAIAALKHRGILPIYEVGEAAGVPYFTTEYVEGRTLAQVVSALRALDVPTDELNTTHLGAVATGPAQEPRAAPDAGAVEPPQLPLGWGKTYVETVCRIVHDVALALQHAHEHGIVHRDVKPSNIMLAGDGRALLFDFGLARIDAEETVTLSGDFAGTPYYVAPEQISARGKEVDARSDVYSLGVTLYELLTLRRPFEGGNAQAIFRQVLSREAPLPRRFNRLIPRDLETICVTALEKAPARRYESAAEMAADLRRFLEFRPVRARPIGWPTRLARLARRHPGATAAVALGGLIALGLPAGLALSNRALGREAERARLAEQSAAREAGRARAVNTFLLQSLRAADPEVAGAPELSVRQLLDLSSESVGTSFKDQPDIEAAVRRTIGNSFVALGRFEDARLHLEEALRLSREDQDAEPGELAQSLYDLGVMRLRDGDPAGAERCFTEALDVRRAAFGDEHADVAESLAGLGAMYADRNRLAESRAAFEQALALRVRLHGAQHREVMRVELSLGKVALLQEDLPAAEQHIRAALALAEALFGPRDLSVATAQTHLGSLKRTKGDYAGAAELWEQALAVRIEVLGPDHLSTAQLQVNLARVARILSDPQRAVELSRAALATQERALGPDHPELVMGLQTLGMALSALRDKEGAYAALERALEIRRKQSSGPDYDLAMVLTDIGRMALSHGDLERAAQVYAEALPMVRATREPGSQAVAGVCMSYGSLQRERGRLEQAEALLREAYAIYEPSLPPGSASLMINRQQLGSVLAERGKHAEALPLLEPVYAFYRGSTHGLIAPALTTGLWLGRALSEAGRTEEAEAHLADLVRWADQLLPEGSPDLADVLAEYGSLLLDRERPAEAVPLLERAVDLGPRVAPEAREAHVEARSALAVALSRTGRFADAEPHALSAYETALATAGPDAPLARAALACLIELYAGWERPEEAERWRARAGARPGDE